MNRLRSLRAPLLVGGLLASIAFVSPGLAAIYGAADGAPSHVAITATAPAWMRVHDANGNNLALRVLKAGDTYRVPDRAGLLIDTGNTKALKISVDGVDMPSIAKPGQSIVQRDIALDPDHLGIPAKQAAAVAPAPETKPAQVALAAPAAAAKPDVAADAKPVANASPTPEPAPVAAAPAPVAPTPITIAAPAADVAVKPVTVASLDIKTDFPVLAPESAAVAQAAPQPAPHAVMRSGSSTADAVAPVRKAAVQPEEKPVRPDVHGLEIEASKGTVVQLREPASTVFVANPEIADVQVKSPTLIYVMGKTPGETSLYAADGSDHVILNAPIRVIHNLSRLRSALTQLMPDEPIRVDSVEGAIVLTGEVSSAQHAADAQAMAQLFVTQSGSQSGGQGGGQQSQGGGQAQGGGAAAAAPQAATVINRLAVIAPNQVNLRVRVAEVARSTLRELGVNWDHSPGRGGNYTFLTENATQLPNQTAENLLRIGLLGPASNPISAQIDAMAQEGLITTLAEPNLTAMSGQTASFLAGGEFPIPVQGSIGSNGAPTITIEFKKYGVSVDFVPTILNSRLVSLRIKSEVSELSTQGAINTGLITVPGIRVRRAETSVELGSGDSFVIGGLLQNNGEHDISKLPALGDLPILGPLFRSDRFQRQETELVIIVTPVLVRPISSQVAASPADGLTRPNDFDRVLTGAPYQQQLAKPGSGDRSTGGQGLIGPAGFQLD